MGKKEERASQVRKVRVSNFAQKNINDLIDYIALENQQPLNALKVLEGLENAIFKVGENPFAYKECDRLQTKTKIYRQAVYKSWLIIYRITPVEILILSIVHGASRPAKIRKLRKIK